MAIRFVSVYKFIISDESIEWNTSGTGRNMFQTKKQIEPFLSLICFFFFFERFIHFLITICCGNGL